MTLGQGLRFLPAPLSMILMPLGKPRANTSREVHTGHAGGRGTGWIGGM